MQKRINIPKIELKIQYKDKVKASELMTIDSIEEAYQSMLKLFNADTIDWIEESILICLNGANKVVGFFKLSQGGVSSTVVDPKVIFTIALKVPCSSIMLAHNHPSGTLTPSPQDRQITKAISDGAKILEIRFLDHLIITSNGYFSFAKEGLL